MSESQLTDPVKPTIKVSSLDSHRFLTDPNRANAGPARPLRDAAPHMKPAARLDGQPLTSPNGDVKFTSAPIDSQMGSGGVRVRHPQRMPIAPTKPTPAQRAGSAEPVALTRDQIAYLRDLVGADLGLVGGARRTFAIVTAQALDEIAKGL